MNTSGQLAVVAILCLSGITAWCSFETQQSTEHLAQAASKLEESGRILMESEECSNRCPAYKYNGDYGKAGSYSPPDNSEHDKCVSACSGEQRQKFRALLNMR